MTRCLLALATLVAALALAACGGGDDTGAETTSAPAPAPGDPAAGLTDYLPTDTQLISIVDFQQARKELGLPADADAASIEGLSSDGGFPADSPEFDLMNAAMMSVPPVRVFAQTLKPSAVDDALDGGAITAAAADLANGPNGAAALRTTQSFDEFADALADHGYERDGDAVTNPDEPISEIADAGDGVWVMSGDDSGPTAKELADSPPGGPAELDALIGDRGPSIGLATSIPDSVSDCLTAEGGHQTADASEGDLVLEVDGEADAGNVDTSSLDQNGIKPGEPTADGSVVTIPFTAQGGLSTSPVGALLAEFQFTELYDCG